jgi:SNF2 family DNA or RNA helicase|tara:strand:+ start:13011 stop:16436 length:3426 start_codon:yes stop_codon:yes gene_type:complete
MSKKRSERISTVIDKTSNDEVELLIISDFTFDELDVDFIAEHSGRHPRQFQHAQGCYLKGIEINAATFFITTAFQEEHAVFVAVQEVDKQLILTCDCNNPKDEICLHQATALSRIIETDSMKMYFSYEKRHIAFKRSADQYGLGDLPNLDDYFELKSNRGSISVELKMKEIPRFDDQGQAKIEKLLFSDNLKFDEKTILQKMKNTIRGVAFSENPYREEIDLTLFEADLTVAGKPKNPFRTISPSVEMQNTDDTEVLRFLSAVSYFKGTMHGEKDPATQLKVLRGVVKNPLGVQFYLTDEDINGSPNARNTREIDLSFESSAFITLDVKQKDEFFEILPFLNLNDRKIEFKKLKLACRYLFEFEKKVFILDHVHKYNLYRFFKEHRFRLLVPKEKFEEFSDKYLSNLEDKVQVNYAFKKEATKKQKAYFLEKKEPTKTIYLSESENFILITPAIRYGKMEVPVLSMKQLSGIDEVGEWFTIERDKNEEDRFIGMLIRQHESFEEQLTGFDHFYIHKKNFYNEGWFITAFSEWKLMNIEVLGFKELKNNNWNPAKISVNIGVSSGLDWFETSAKIKFNDQTATLQQVQKAIRNKTNYVKLGDGTHGLLPEEWIEKFSKYFRSGDMVEGKIRISKINYSLINDLFEDEQIDTDILKEIDDLKMKISSFQNVKSVKIPKKLNGVLRDYQHEGLNWLHFLDEFNFGGCLADDMGLGKTIQIISFILSLKEQKDNKTHLVVVPTSLLFNWNREIEKFAPSLKMLNNYGTNRVKSVEVFKGYDVILTTYGTLLSDISKLKKFDFDYVFLDESQAIKNPDSMRYKAARLLNSRNRIVLTGTPIENNTFDLFAQFSFAIPGLFGSQNRFRDEYSIPIDKFKDSARAKELQNKINPFLLRRTKKQVAKELPEKTEMVLFCEMGEEQRQVYDSYRNDIRESLLSRDTVEHDSNKSILLLQGLTKLRQICNSPKLLPEDVDYGHESAKMEVLMKEIQSRHKHHKILVFSQFVTMLDLIRRELDKAEISHEYLTGKSKNREEIVHRFQNDDEVRVFLISLKAGGTGLNLTEADYVYIVDPWWNPAVENQAIDRCYRIGQKKNVVAVRLICPNTLEEKIMRMQESKKELADDLVRTDASVIKSLSNDDLINLFD